MLDIDFSSPPFAQKTLTFIPSRPSVTFKSRKNAANFKKKYKHEAGYNSKPKKRGKKITRKCIGPGKEGGHCGNDFVARGKFNRLCRRCTKWVADNA